MRVKILKTRDYGAPPVEYKAGDTPDLPPEVAEQYIGQGYAEEIKSTKSKTPVEASEEE